ncbi:hypothetical protein C8J33_10820 [Rhizobium sp. PP-CC-3G-465]|nr:hypothetical protein C8J33_10820 [Rhizobium sp. PP-CC-3G-465]
MRRAIIKLSLVRGGIPARCVAMDQVATGVDAIGSLKGEALAIASTNVLHHAPTFVLIHIHQFKRLPAESQRRFECLADLIFHAGMDQFDGMLAVERAR